MRVIPPARQAAGVGAHHAQVDDPRRHHQPAAVDPLCAVGHVRVGGGDRAVGDQQGAAPLARHRADQPRVGERQRALDAHAQPSTPRAQRVRTSRHAMRTATPIATCSVIADRAGSSATLERDLDPAVHRAGVHHQRIGLRPRQPRGREAIAQVELARRRHIAARHPLGLKPQHHHHVGTVECRIHVAERGNEQPLGRRRHQRRRRTDADLGAERGQREDVRPRHPAVQHVAADHHPLPRDAAAPASDSQRVEQRLRRVLVPPVAGVEHRAIDLVGDQPDRARAHVPDHQHVGAHRVQRLRGVDQRLALLYRALRRMHVDDVGAEPLARDLEAQQRAGRVLEERVDLGQARQPLVGHVARADPDPTLRLVEQERDLVRLQPGDAGEVPVRKGGAAGQLGGGRMVAGHGRGIAMVGRLRPVTRAPARRSRPAGCSSPPACRHARRAWRG